MRRTDLQAFSQAKLDDAKLLLANQRPSNAYYLAGYAVEFGLKACIARQISADTLPDRDFVQSIYVHDFPRLLSAAGLAREHKDAQAADGEFAAYWAIAAEWRPDIRYKSVNMIDAQLLCQAIDNPDHGVLQWIRQYW